MSQLMGVLRTFANVLSMPDAGCNPPAFTFTTTPEFFMNTTISNTAHAAETLAASILILEVLKDVELSESFQEHDIKLDLLATLVASTFSPAEA